MERQGKRGADRLGRSGAGCLWENGDGTYIVNLMLI